MQPYSNAINITTTGCYDSTNHTAAQPVAQNCYVNLGYHPGCAAPPMATWITNGPLLTQLSEADKEALKVMIREVVVDAVKEVLDARDEAERRERFNDQW